MDELLNQIKIRVNEKVYLKDPESSELGKRIIQHSILMIDKVGLEVFTFKKLAEELQTTESSIYRYFENKHKLLIYLISWYWGWLEYKLVLTITNITDPEKKLEKAIKMICEPVKQDSTFSHIDEVVLHEIVISESSKAYMTKEIDQENKEGFFLGYKRLCKRISDIIKEINPKYQFPSALVSTMMEAALHQIYFAKHLPSLTEAGNDPKKMEAFITGMLFKTIT